MNKAAWLKSINAPLEVEPVNDLVPQPGEVIVKLKAASLNRRDFWITRGKYPGISPPVVLGSDGAGIVTRVGSDVDQAWMDSEVIINPGLDWGENDAAQGDQFHILGLPKNGTLASEVAVPHQQLHPKPAKLNWRECAALPLAGVTAYRALFTQGRLREGQRVLITGAGGGVATMALQFAVASRCDAWVSSSSEEKIEQAIQLGARGGVNYTQPDWSRQLKEQMSGSPNLILDGAGGSQYSELVNLLAPGGAIVNYGATAGAPDPIDLFKLFWKQIRIQGTTMGSPSDFQAMTEFVDEHTIRPVIHQVFALEEVNLAIELMKSSPQFGKLVIEIPG